MTPSDLIIRADLDAGAAARMAVMRWMGDHPRIDDALLAVTELVNNAVVHGQLEDGQALTVRLSSEDDHVRLTVLHAGQGFQVQSVPPPSMAPDASRGLAIVDRIADRWGVDADGSEVAAWFEMSPGLSDLIRG